MRPSEAGLTLVELLVTLVIAALILGFAVPGMGALIARNRVVTTTNALVQAVQTARSLAVRNGRGTAVICPADGDDCDLAADWSNGWLIFADLNRSGERDPAEKITARWGPTAPGITVAGDRISITFTPDGYLSTPEGAALVVCDTSGRIPPRTVRLWGLGAFSIFTPDNCDLPN